MLGVRKQQYAYSEVQSMTDNFSVVLGKGGFGTVYHGCIDDTQVAVKVLSQTSDQGDKEFQAEVHKHKVTHTYDWNKIKRAVKKCMANKIFSLMSGQSSPEHSSYKHNFTCWVLQ